MPSIFDVYLIEVDESDEKDDQKSFPAHFEDKDTELQILKSENSKLNEEIERLKDQYQSKTIIMNARIEHIKAMKVKQFKEIQSLKEEVANLKEKLTEAQRTINENFQSADIDVNIFFEFSSILAMHDYTFPID